MLTKDEAVVVAKLVEAWEAFVALPREHDDDVTEFRSAIHAAQRTVLARPARRTYGVELAE